MKELSDAEYRTILAILSVRKGSEKDRIRSSALPSSTYHVVKSRIYAAGWVRDRWIPNIGAWGLDPIEIRLAQPSLDGSTELIGRWSSDPSCAVLWSGVHAILGVFVGPSPTGRVPPGPSDDDVVRIRVTRTSGAIPVFFDYAGLWARLGGEGVPGEYPAGLDLRAAVSDARALATIRRATASISAESSDGDGPTALANLPPDVSRLVERGLLEPRTVLDPGALPSHMGRRLGEVLVISGRLRAGADGPALLGRLNRESGVFPFLFAEGDGTLLFAGFGGIRSGDGPPSPVRAVRRPVLPIVNDALEGARLVVEPTDRLVVRVDHRYPSPPAIAS